MFATGVRVCLWHLIPDSVWFVFQFCWPRGVTRVLCLDVVFLQWYLTGEEQQINHLRCHLPNIAMVSKLIIGNGGEVLTQLGRGGFTLTTQSHKSIHVYVRPFLTEILSLRPHPHRKQHAKRRVDSTGNAIKWSQSPILCMTHC